MEFEVETAGVTDWLTLGVPPPEGGGVGLAVGADHPRPPVPGPGVRDLDLGGGRAPDGGPGAGPDPVHLAVVGTTVAQLGTPLPTTALNRKG